MRRRLTIRLLRVIVAGTLPACGGEHGSKPAAAPAAPPASVPPAASADALVLRTPGGTELWSTFAREGRDGTGAPCLEHALEIRSSARRIPIPLLYTRDIPRLVNDSTVSARVWNHCAPGDEYRINLRTGQPVRAPR
jgi:hypothetical protein